MNLFIKYLLLCIETFALTKIFTTIILWCFISFFGWLLTVPLHFGFAKFISTIFVLANIVTGKVPCRLLTTKAQSYGEVCVCVFGVFFWGGVVVVFFFGWVGVCSPLISNSFKKHLVWVYCIDS